MGWGKFDDAYPHHPKLLAVGAEGLALDVAAVCYANRYGTDGWVPEPMLGALYPPIKSPRKVAAKLVAVGRWEAGDGGWWIHDFTDYNPTSMEAAEKREKRARAGRKGGLKSKPSPRNEEANGEANASGGASPPLRTVEEANGNPDPTPTPKPSPDGEAAAPPNGEVSEKFSTRLARELTAEHGVEFASHDTAHQSFTALLSSALSALPPERHHATAMGVIADYVAFAQGSLSREARNHTARLVSTHDPSVVLHAYGEAMNWGAGLRPEHANDPLALSKYVAGVLAKRKAS